MELNDFYNRMREEVREFAIGRSESSAFLIWFLENFFRLETQNAIDAICDQQNDKGIDGIFVDDEEETIYLFQSKYSPNNNSDQGDNDIRNFIGAREWFENEDSINRLLASNTSRELKLLIKNSKISEKINFKIISIFVTNKSFDRNAKEYINIATDLETYDKNDLFNKFTYFADEENTFPPLDLFLNNHSKIEYNLPDGTISKVYSIKAKELVKLEGIQDRTLFYKNVRYGVGKTRVNKSITSTIADSDEHNNFFLYHNGITIICQDLNDDELETNNKITINNYAVINGCQSMLTFYENQNNLSNNLFVLVKIIKLNLTSPIVKKITYFANNQNSISLKDLRSNDSAQKTLQREFDEIFGNNVFYMRKRGESIEGYSDIIDKDFAAQIIEATYLKRPNNTHLKQKLFGEEYTKIFSRKITGDKIYLGYLIYNIIKNNASLLDNIQIRNYGLSIFFFSHAIFEILKQDELGNQIIENPREYVTVNKEFFCSAISQLWNLITPFINTEIDEYTAEHDNFFDYKNVFKNKEFVIFMCGKLKRDAQVLLRMDQNNAFKNIYENISNNE